MDAVEYVKTLRRLCKSKERCPGCKLYNKEDGYCIVDTSEYAEEAVQIVEQWAKDNPVKTRQSEFLKMFPNAVTDDGVLCIGPCEVEKGIVCVNGKTCDDCCRKYWLAEVTDNE